MLSDRFAFASAADVSAYKPYYRLFRRALLLYPIIIIALVAAQCTSTGQSTPLSQGPTVEAGTSLEDQAVDGSVSQAVRLSDWKEVVRLSSHTLLAKPQDLHAFYWQGIGYLQLHNSLAAAQSLRNAEKLGLDDTFLHEALGLAYYDLNQFVLFKRQMERASQLSPHDFRPKYYLGLYMLDIQSNPSTALESFREARQLQPDDWKSVYEEGKCLEFLGKPLEASERYRRAIDIVEAGSQHFGWPFQGIARLLVETKPLEALGYAKRAVELEPEEYSNHLVLSRVYEALDDLPQAINEASVASDKNSTDAASLYKLFTLYRRVGDRSAANAELAKFQKVKATYGPE